MVTQVNLFNRYRPQNLDEIVGQEAISRILSNALLQQRLANAYLLRGPRGSGKTSIARIVCKAANCEALKGFTACGMCVGCKFALYDAVELDAASNRGIEDIRTLIENVYYRPQHVDKKFIIVDEAHQLTSAALNALLKVVEEPPKHVHFIFCTTENPASPSTDTDKAFVTLSSRCQILQFKKVSPKAMLDKLARICIAENRTVSHDILLNIIGKSDGSLRDAENILDTILTLSNSEPPERVIDFLYGTIEQLTLTLFKNCCVDTLDGSFLTARKLWDSGANPMEISEFMLKFVTDSIYLRSGLTVYRASDTVNELKEISNNVEQTRLTLIATAFTALKRSNRDDLLSLELTLCDIFSGCNEDVDSGVLVPSDIEVW